MPTTKLSRRQRQVAFTALDDAAGRYRPADRRTWHHRTTMLAEMARLGLADYRGITRSLLATENAYTGRVYYTRKVRVRAVADGTRIPVPPGRPAITDLFYELASLDGLRCLSIALSPGVPYQPPANQAEAALAGDLPTPVACTPEVVMLRRDDPDRPYHRVRSLPWALPRLNPVWFHTTSASIWPIAEQIWQENLPRRPLPRPLSPDSVLVRARVHHGGLVKAVTPATSHVGYCRPTYTDGTLESVFLAEEPHSGAGVRVPATPILEIVPWHWAQTGDAAGADTP